MLPEALHASLRREAFQKRTSLAQIIRSKLEGPARRKRKKDPLDEVIGIGSDGHMTEKIDEDLYDL